MAPPYAYAGVSFSNVVATWCQYEVLKYVSFPLQTLGKCAKMIPVMVWGTLIMRKRYGAKDYLNAGGQSQGRLEASLVSRQRRCEITRPASLTKKRGPFSSKIQPQPPHPAPAAQLPSLWAAPCS